MGGELPKQYLRLGGKSIAEHTLGSLLSLPQLHSILVCIHPQDHHWRRLRIARTPGLRTVPGGERRSQSVLNALQALKELAAEGDWVLIHDLVRPCIQPADVERLLHAVGNHPVGGLLALPLQDTIKESAAPPGASLGVAQPPSVVLRTLDRSRLWRAQTPQVFRYGMLLRALEECTARNHPVTDEAQALEVCAAAPLLVEGAPGNLKITHPQDLPLAALYLRHRQRRARPRTAEKAAQ